MVFFKTLFKSRKKVLFVCRGNAIRSQMAEALATHLAADVMEAHSAGTRPAHRVSRRAIAVLAEKGVVIPAERDTRSVRKLNLRSYDLIVNLADEPVPGTETLGEDTIVMNLPVADPMKGSQEEFREVRDRLVLLVKLLANAARRERSLPIEPPTKPRQIGLEPAPASKRPGPDAIAEA
jgi:protein-tyrosine-phosphatase